MKMLLTQLLAAIAPIVHGSGGQMSCERLTDIALAQTQIVAAKLIAAGSFNQERSDSGQAEALNAKFSDNPAFCRVQGVARPTSDSHINFEVWLPVAASWNGRYYQHGEGGNGGSINHLAMMKLLRDGSAVAATDDGHVRAKDWNYSWALNHPEKIIDQSYRALALTAESAKILVRAYYGRPPSYRYFEGCSGGGNYAMVAAQRFPQEWDGILVGAPSNNALGYFAANGWNSRSWSDKKTRIVSAKLPAIQRAALNACTPRAKVVNGIPTDPRFCSFDPTVLACAHAESDECLTKSQIETLQKIYAGPRNPRTGEQIYPGFPPTGETNWLNFLTDGPESLAGIPRDVPFNLISTNIFYRNYVFDDPKWDVRTFDFDDDIKLTEEKMIAGERLKSLMNATNADLSPLRGQGAKMLMYFGWADPALTPLEGIAYYENVARLMGGYDEVQGFYRLFMVPGMGHCAGGAGANSFGQFMVAPALKDDASHHILRALEAWVETARPPDRIIAAKYVNDDPTQGVAFTRPLCPYPQAPIYKGTGNIADAFNFKCE